MPARNTAGMKTAESTSAIPTSAPPTSSIASSAASCGERPCSIFASVASTTTIASSTTRPTASTSPSSESVLTENPTAGKNMKAPTSDTGIVRIGISVARQRDRLEQGLHNFPCAFGHRHGGVKRQGHRHVPGKALRELGHLRLRAIRGLERVGAGILEEEEQRARRAIHV